MSDVELIKTIATIMNVDVPKNSPWAGVDERVGIWRDVSGAGDGTRFTYWNPLTQFDTAVGVALQANIDFGVTRTPDHVEAFAEKAPSTNTGTPLRIVKTLVSNCTSISLTENICRAICECAVLSAE